MGTVIMAPLGIVSPLTTVVFVQQRSVLLDNNFKHGVKTFLQQSRSLTLVLGDRDEEILATPDQGT